MRIATRGIALLPQNDLLYPAFHHAERTQRDVTNFPFGGHSLSVRKLGRVLSDTRVSVLTGR